VNNGKAKFLKWDKREADYYDVFIDMNQKEEIYDR
jgi:dsDNA-binding SOS-regulon protein